MVGLHKFSFKKLVVHIDISEDLAIPEVCTVKARVSVETRPRGRHVSKICLCTSAQRVDHSSPEDYILADRPLRVPVET